MASFLLCSFFDRTAAFSSCQKSLPLEATSSGLICWILTRKVEISWNVEWLCNLARRSTALFFQSFFSVQAAWIIFVNDLMKFSASKFAWGQSGVFRWCFAPISAIYDPNLWGPILLFTIIGTPCVANMHSNFSLAAVQLTISASRNCEYASLTTKRYLPVGKGSQKSMWTVCHGLVTMEMSVVDQVLLLNCLLEGLGSLQTNSSPPSLFLGTKSFLEAVASSWLCLDVLNGQVPTVVDIVQSEGQFELLAGASWQSVLWHCWRASTLRHQHVAWLNLFIPLIICCYESALWASGVFCPPWLLVGSQPTTLLLIWGVWQWTWRTAQLIFFLYDTSRLGCWDRKSDGLLWPFVRTADKWYSCWRKGYPSWWALSGSVAEVSDEFGTVGGNHAHETLNLTDWCWRSCIVNCIHFLRNWWVSFYQEHQSKERERIFTNFILFRAGCESSIHNLS